MRKISVLLALFALCLAEIVLANGVVTTANGSVQVVRGASPARPLRQGDEVNQGDTVVTGPASSVVLKFDDGQVTALTANSRMTISAYEYEARQGTGNVLLSLIDGGMRAITGLIGKANPQRVNYRAASATIGIRGTDVTLVTRLGAVVATVREGSISLTFRGRTVIVRAGEGVNARTDGTFQQGAAEEIIRRLPQELRDAIGGLQGLQDAIARAAPGLPRSGTTSSDGNSITTPGGSSSGGTGGAASPS
jgi:hypothetical protein